MKERDTTICENEIAGVAKIIQLLLKMETDIIAEKGSLIVPSEVEKEGYVSA
jgi:hypothetical protein